MNFPFLLLRKVRHKESFASQLYLFKIVKQPVIDMFHSPVDSRKHFHCILMTTIDQGK
jgi:hypothetical protein